jgi:diadenosine tetraphosphate (Ap4A) HIT family hydrolase
MALAIYSNQPYSEIYQMAPKERKALANVLEEKANAEKKAMQAHR